MHFRLDQLAKNILREFFVLVGAVDTEVKVPAGDAQRIDVWHVPDPVLLANHPEIEPGLLRAMAAEPGMVEVYSDAPGTADFLDCMRKRFSWHHALELRATRRLPLPAVWIVSAGRPAGVLREFGIVRGTATSEGLYTTPAPGWRVQVVVISELSRTRDTLLLRLLGAGRVRSAALRDLGALPEDAWERRLAVPWLVRPSFEVPEELPPELPDEERAFIVETREWFEQFQRQWVAKKLQQAEERGLERGLERGIEHGVERGLERGRLEMAAQICAKRLGRPLTERENAALSERLARLGEDQIVDTLLTCSPSALSAWLEEPCAGGSSR